jgi:phosphotransferase system  glucose/maltose/N-acetylglucosamine-specific IIC component
MKSSIVVFVAAFAAMGLLLGVAASLDVPMLQKPEFQNTAGMTNSTSAIGIEEQVQVNVEKAGE